MRRYAKIIEDKSTKNCVTFSKTATWAEYNAQCETGPHLVRQLKVLYDNLKRSTRKTVAEKHVSYTQEPYTIRIARSPESIRQYRSGCDVTVIPQPFRYISS
jgi:(2Fe-2S) ferredoxin